MKPIKLYTYSDKDDKFRHVSLFYYMLFYENNKIYKFPILYKMILLKDRIK